MTTFSELELDARVLKAVTEAGYETPTPIQEQAIPHALQGRDVLGIAQTGTGKTASFTLPMITMLAKGRARARMPRSLVLAPTRELAAQVAENFETYAKHMKLSMALLIGGVSFKDQDKLIDRGVDVLIATPGRLLDHFERGKLMLTGVQVMVVDEADRMLDMGFIPDIERIFSLTPFTRQTLFFSATMAPEITRITNTFLSNPVRVEVARQATTSETITQGVAMHKPSRRDRADKEKRDVLRALISAEGEALTNGIVFCNRKRDVDIVAKSLKKHGFNADPIHGDLDQSLRTKILNSFRDQDLTILVASDVAARGLDIPSVSHVFNFDVPIHSEDYVHRIGRTGRAGRAGKAITICQPSDMKYLEKIEELVEKVIPRLDLPSGLDLPSPDETEAQDDAPSRSGRGRGRRSSGGDRRGADSNTDSPVEARGRSDRDRSERGGREQEPREQTDRDRNSQDRGDRDRGDRDRSDRDRGGRRRGGRGRNDGGGGPKVVGLGDHVPAFLLRPLRREDTGDLTSEVEADIEVASAEDQTPVNQVADTPSDTPSDASAEAAPRPRKRSRTKAKATSEADAMSEAEAASDTVATADDSADTAAKEAPKRKPRARKAAAAPVTEANPETIDAPNSDARDADDKAETPEVDAKPKRKPRTRKPAAAKTTEASAESADSPKDDAAAKNSEADAKPKRKPRARKTAPTDAPVDPPAEATAPPEAEATTPSDAPAKPTKKPRKRVSAKAVLEASDPSEPDAA